MPVRVAFNAIPLLSPPTGIGNYIIEVGRALAFDAGIDGYSFYGYRWRHGTPVPVPPASAASSIAGRLKGNAALRAVAREAARHLGFRRGLRRHRVDVYHEQNFVPLAYDVPTVVTIHDLSWVHHPATHPPDRVRWLTRGVPKAIERAAAIVTVSAYVRDELIATFGVAPGRVHAIPLGVGPHFRPREAAQTASTIGPLGLRYRGFVLTVGTIEPRKNLRHIVEAHALLPPRLRERYPLVIAGARGWSTADAIGALRTGTDPHLVFLGAVSGDVLRDLYAAAAAFAFPSLYEGFGLPPLEAMASGTPVIVSDRGALPEVVGDAGLRMDPLDREDTARRLAALLEDDALCASLASKGLERAAAFDWATCAAATARIYREVAGKEARAFADESPARVRLEGDST